MILSFMGERTRSSQGKGKQKALRSRTRILLARFKQEANSGEISPELQTQADEHFRTLFRFKQKS